MARTYIPPCGDLSDDFDAQKFLEDSYENLKIAKGDEDKADEIENACFYEGQASILAWNVERMTGENPLARPTSDAEDDVA